MSEYNFIATQQPSIKPDLPDLESSRTDKAADDTRLWLRMLSCCNLIENELRSRIRSEFQTTLPRFDLMSQLAYAPKGLKMSDLSKLMMVTNGNITGITDQLEKDGLVERIRDESDRRSSIIKLTAKGKRYYKRLQHAHENWISTLLSGLAPNSRSALFDLLGDLKQATYARLPVN